MGVSSQVKYIHSKVKDVLPSYNCGRYFSVMCKEFWSLIKVQRHVTTLLARCLHNNTDPKLPSPCIHYVLNLYCVLNIL